MGQFDLVINIDLDNIQKSMKKINAFPGQFEDAILNSIIECEAEMESKLQDNLARYGLEGSEVASLSSVVADVDGITVQCLSDHADFVEFGTGIVGQSNPHPNPMLKGWRYAIGKKIDPITGMWTYFDDKIGWFRQTKGQPSRPFIFKTMAFGESRLGYLIKKNVRRIKV